MKRLLLVGAAVAGVALVARRAARGCGSFDFESMIERMPENAPPKWMFRNINAIRDNTERILKLLEASARPRRPRTCAPPRSARQESKMAVVLAYVDAVPGRLYPLVDTLLELTKRGHHVAVRCGIDDVERLRSIGLDAKSLQA